jgi:rhodanese-related sulfurtransferase
MIAERSPAWVRDRLLARAEIALLDLREEAAHAEAHPLFAANLPLSALEEEAAWRLPRRDVPVVLIDAGEGLAERGARRLAALGYTDVALLAGGLAGWAAAGYELFQDVNSFSKAFGELVEARRHTPSLPAEEVRARLDRGENLVVLDARRFDEYRTMSVPRGISVPGAELVLRAPLLAPDPATTIIVNCAGRTRSLIGAQSLIDAGLPNPVHALRNGTIGWTLAGFELETGQMRQAPAPTAQAVEAGRARAAAVAARAGARRLGAHEAARTAAEPGRTVYRYDVRGLAEHIAGHPPGYLWAEGGQLVQETDVFVAVRGARVLLYDPLGSRALMTASWLRQMGIEADVVEGLDDSESGEAPRPAFEAPEAPSHRPETVAQMVASGVRLIDLAPSALFRKGHIPGARFAVRSRLVRDLGAIGQGSAVLTSPDGKRAAWAAADLREEGISATVLAGGTAAWAAARLPLEQGDGDPLAPFEDRYRRPYEGTDNPRAAMQAYLDWEYGLVAQLARDGTHFFEPIDPA